MKNLKILLSSVLFSALLTSCSNDDSEEQNINNNTITYKKSITYTPLQSNFTEKLVRYFENNTIVLDSTFNAQSQFLRKSVYTYESGNKIRFNYNAANALTGKIIYTYDNLNRLTNVDSYNASNQLDYSNVFSYQNENIYLTRSINGISTLTYHYKTNADGYLYYEENFSNNNNIKTLDYIGDKPLLLHYGLENYTAGYLYYPQLKPSDLQNTVIETNNFALANNVLEHVHFSCNYYLKEITFNIGQGPLFLKREYLFNENNYETYLKTYNEDANGTTFNSSETFTFYY